MRTKGPSPKPFVLHAGYLSRNIATFHSVDEFIRSEFHIVSDVKSQRRPKEFEKGG